MAPYTGRSRWDQYQAALKRHPHRMQLLQAVTLSLLGNVCNQCVLAPANRTFNAALVVEQVSINIIISPVTIHWFRALERWRLHWVVATLADQLIFNVVLNACVWYYVAAFFRGGLAWAPEGGLRLHASVFPSLLTYKPIWSTRVKGMQLKLPTTLLRERLVPAHLKGIYELGVRLIWAVIVAAQLSSWLPSS
jgi:hypothetical protein